jgi:flagellar basal body-associated protein FliL
MLNKLEQILKDKEKKAKLLFWIWLISLILTVLGYIIIFYIFLKQN